MLGRTPTRAAAWRAIHARRAELLSTLGSEHATLMIEATAGLCEHRHRAEVEAAFLPAIGTIVDGKRALAQALASIDRCVATAGKP
jgi:hypothetical protein